MVSGLAESATIGHFSASGTCHKQLWRVDNLAAHHVSLVINVERAPNNVAAHQHSRVNSKAPVSPQPVDCVWWCFKVVNLPVLKDPAVAVGQVLPCQTC
jgi:hypothetical protein